MRLIIQIATITVLFSLLSCKKKVDELVVYDNVIYDIDNVSVYASNAQKTKQKSAELMISIMYADLFNQGVTTNTLLELSEIYLAMGDKTMFNELIFSHFFKDPMAVIPTDIQMRNDIGQFVEDSYLRFFQRYPSEYEKIYLVNLIDDDTDITVENVYTSFILSNEYFFY